MAKMDGGALIGRILKENRVRYCFAINGGHLFPILANLRNNDIKLIHMRHEQATAYAADAYARSSGEVGVCMVTAGCGLTNAVTGLCVAGLTGSEVVLIQGPNVLKGSKLTVNLKTGVSKVEGGKGVSGVFTQSNDQKKNAN